MFIFTPSRQYLRREVQKTKANSLKTLANILSCQAISAVPVCLLVLFELGEVNENLHDVPHFADSSGIQPSSVAVRQDIKPF